MPGGHPARALPVWEDANDRGFIARQHQPGQGELRVGLDGRRGTSPLPSLVLGLVAGSAGVGRVQPRENLSIDREYLRESQYKDPTNLNARIALHAKYTQADEPWYPWLVGRIDWPAGAEVLEVGCGTGALWANVAPFLPDLRLTLTDLSEGMLAAAERAVSPLTNIELTEARPCDVQELPFPDGCVRRRRGEPHAVPRPRSAPRGRRAGPGAASRRCAPGGHQRTRAPRGHRRPVPPGPRLVAARLLGPSLRKIDRRGNPRPSVRLRPLVPAPEHHGLHGPRRRRRLHRLGRRRPGGLDRPASRSGRRGRGPVSRERRRAAHQHGHRLLRGP